MVTFIVEPDQVDVPDCVVDLASFRDWMESDSVPEKTRICFLNGRVWVDMSKEQVFSHVAVKTEFTVVLGGIARHEGLGRFFQDGVLLINLDAELGCKPDGVFVSLLGLQERVRRIEGKRGGAVELEGSPDMVLEVISDGSVKKDTIILRKAYWEAGVREYWLVDARKGPPSFEILKHTARGYVSTRKQVGWVKSAIFGRSFRLVQGEDAMGDPVFTLEVR